MTQTGVQILAGFLLILPFQARFSQLGAVYRVLYLVAMALATLATLATCLIIAPVSSHRLLFRQHEKGALVESSSNLAKAGLVAMALAIVTVVVLIFGVVLDLTAGVVAGTIALVLFALFWVVLPMLLLRRGRS